ncbi:MAG: hypothetical protein WD270_01020 [Acetobacterales bacterium]
MTRETRRVPMREAITALAERDAHLRHILEAHGPPPGRPHDRGFPGLMRIILAQQIATGAARAIHARLQAACPDMSAAAFLALDDATLRAVGLSRGKIAYGRALAEAVAGGALDFRRLHRQGDEAAIAAISGIKGLGRWSAQMYLLFALKRPDIWPTGDLAVRRGLAAAKGLEADPEPAEMERLAEPWRPYRSAAARLMWHYYGTLHGRDATPD